MPQRQQFERLIPCPPRRLWQALVRDAEATEQGVMLRLALRVTRYESPRLLECQWGRSALVRWELAPHGDDATLLVITHLPLPIQA